MHSAISLAHDVVFRLAAALLMFGVFIAAGAFAAPPALVIANWKYDPELELNPLRTPEQDAKVMKTTLEGLEQPFAVTVHTNLGKADLRRVVTEFIARHKNEPVLLIYFSGHGIQVNNANYLLATDSDLRVADKVEGLKKAFSGATLNSVIETLKEETAQKQALALNEILALLPEANPAALPLHLLILDACRSNPFVEGPVTKGVFLGKGAGGLAQVVVEKAGLFVGFAASANQEAMENDPRLLVNPDPAKVPPSLFTEHLTKRLSKGGSVDQIFNETATDVLMASARLVTERVIKNRQTPARYALAYRPFVFVPKGGQAPPPGGLVSNPQPQRPTTMPAIATRTPQVISAASILDQGEVGKVIQVKLPGDVLMKFCYCPPGSFVMGSPKNEAGRDDDEDQVSVRISKGFWTGQMEVTQAQWKALMGNYPSSFKGNDLPVETVSWEDAQAFITKLNQTVNLSSGWKCALLTEAQWEYACRAGTESVFHHGNTLTGKQVNFSGISPYGVSEKGPYSFKTVKVGSFMPNTWGLYDMHGNVYEWCSDLYEKSLVGGTDPQGPTNGSQRVYRGGSWFSYGRDCRSAHRQRHDPEARDYIVGFRVAAVPVESHLEKPRPDDTAAALTPEERQVVLEHDAWRTAEIARLKGELPELKPVIENLKKGTWDQYRKYLSGETPELPKEDSKYQRLLLWLHLDPPLDPEMKRKMPSLLAVLRQDTLLLDLWSKLNYAGSPNAPDIREEAKRQLHENTSAWSPSQKNTLSELAGGGSKSESPQVPAAGPKAGGAGVIPP